jgi:hypothetical protein
MLLLLAFIRHSNGVTYAKKQLKKFCNWVHVNYYLDCCHPRLVYFFPFGSMISHSNCGCLVFDCWHNSIGKSDKTNIWKSKMMFQENSNIADQTKDRLSGIKSGECNENVIGSASFTKLPSGQLIKIISRFKNLSC